VIAHKGKKCESDVSVSPDFKKIQEVISYARLQFVHLFKQHHQRLSTWTFLRHLTNVSVQVTNTLCTGASLYKCDILKSM